MAELTLRDDDQEAARAESAWVALGDVYSAFHAGSKNDAAQRLGDALGDARGADLLADDLVVHGHAAQDVSTFSTWLAETASGSAGTAAARLIESRQAEAAGDVDAARALVDSALEADPAYSPARWDAAWHGALRDDYDAALAHLEHLDVPKSDADVRHWQLAGQWRAGRSGGSAPCVCGSGRHQKRCCGKDGMELHLLWWKLQSFLFRAPQRGTVLNVAAALAGLQPDDDDLDERLGSDAFEHALVHPLTASLALVHGGLAARYRDAWGASASPAEQRLLDLIVGAAVDVWVIPPGGRSQVQSLDGRRNLLVRNSGALASAGSEPGCVVAAVTGDGARSDAYLLGAPVRLRRAPVEGPPIEVAEMLHHTDGTDVTALAAALAPFIDTDPDAPLGDDGTQAAERAGKQAARTVDGPDNDGPDNDGPDNDGPDNERHDNEGHDNEAGPGGPHADDDTETSA